MEETNNSSDSELEEDYDEEEYDPYTTPFDCPKCGSDYKNIFESEYKPCDSCSNNYCKSCRNFCDNCKKEICFRCCTYSECCDKNNCNECTNYCDYCQDYFCGSCNIEKICINCNAGFCPKHISSDHKIDVCIECCVDFCTICSEQTFYSPCTECVYEIEDIIDKFQLPVEMNKHILSYICDYDPDDVENDDDEGEENLITNTITYQVQNIEINP